MFLCCAKLTVLNFFRITAVLRSRGLRSYSSLTHIFSSFSLFTSLPPAPLLRDMSLSHIPSSRHLFAFTLSCCGCCCGLCDRSAPVHFSSGPFYLLPYLLPLLLIRLFHPCHSCRRPLSPEREGEEKSLFRNASLSKDTFAQTVLELWPVSKQPTLSNCSCHCTKHLWDDMKVDFMQSIIMMQVCIYLWWFCSFSVLYLFSVMDSSTLFFEEMII